MVVYLIFALFPIALAMVYSSGNKHPVNFQNKTKKSFLIICGIALFLVVALRSKYNGSTDSLNYYNNWSFVGTMSWGELQDFIDYSRMESGYLYTVWGLTRFLKEPQLVFVFTGILFSVSVCRFVYKNCEDVVLGFFMYVTLGLYIFMVQGLRQAIAMSICLFAIEFAKNRKLILFVLVVLLASFYHQSALAFLVVYLLYQLKMNFAGYAIAASASLVFILAGSLFVDYANELFERDYHGAETSGGVIALAIYVIALFVAVLFGGEKKNDRNFSFFFYFTWFGFIIFVMRYTEVLIIERISFYFAFGQMSLLTSVLQNLKRKERVSVKIVLVVLSFVLFAYRLSSSDLIPYEFFWQ